MIATRALELVSLWMETSRDEQAQWVEGATSTALRVLRIAAQLHLSNYTDHGRPCSVAMYDTPELGHDYIGPVASVVLEVQGELEACWDASGEDELALRSVARGLCNPKDLRLHRAYVNLIRVWHVVYTYAPVLEQHRSIQVARAFDLATQMLVQFQRQLDHHPRKPSRVP